MSKLIKRSVLSLITLIAFLGATTTFALEFPLPSGQNNVVGKVQFVKAGMGDTAADVSRRYDVGIYELMRANPGVAHNSTFHLGRELVIPTQFILPPGPREGIVINLAEFRLYYYPKGQNIVITEPVGIGKEGEDWSTPTGKTKVVSKHEDPVWRPTAMVRADAAANGTPIPAMFPAGPDNPLGKHTLRLSWATYLIHGTNNPGLVGARVSAGCIRMFPEDIKNLYEIVPLGTPVLVLNQPFKAGWDNGELLFEAHQPLKEQAYKYRKNMIDVVNAVQKSLINTATMVRWSLVQQAVKVADGVPIQIN